MTTATPFRADNFCAGPASLPTAVLQRAQAELLDWQGLGVSVMEMSHRSKRYESMAATAEANLRTLMGVPDNYKLLFLQGGASLQFASVPLNLTGSNKQTDYIDTGIWSTKAIKEGARYTELNVCGSSKDSGYLKVPSQDELQLSESACYLHYCPNETIGGLKFDYVPQSSAPLVADFSSSILSEQINVADYGLIYAGAQKNIGPAGLTIVVVREDLLNQQHELCPLVMNYREQAANDSMLNTPATYSWYLAALVFEWLLEQGGVSAMEQVNRKKANLLYNLIDQSEFYSNHIAPNNRSLMNVPFVLRDESKNALFLEQSEAANLLNLKGHRSVGGMRASIYNAVSLDSVERLATFMQEFEQKHG